MFGSVPQSAHGAYETIAATICASERGRWFLAEYARRNRAADTDMLLGAITRLEQTVTAERGHEAFGHLRGNLVDMADAISRTKAEIAAINAANTEQTRLSQASLALDAIVRATEQATSDILGSAEAIQEAAWTLRERGADAAACDALDRHATGIYTACSFQDLTAQRIDRIVYTLRYLEDRLSAMIAIWGNDAPVPPLPGARTAGTAGDLSDLCQSDIDRYIAMDVPAVTAAAFAARPGSPTLHEDIVFLPVARGAEAEPEAEPEAAPEADALPAAAAPADGGDALPDATALDWADLVAAVPDRDPGPVETGPSLAEIDALSPTQRLALFA